MDIILIIVGVFLAWQGQLKVTKDSTPWPESKKNGRKIGVAFVVIGLALFLIPFVWA